MENEIPLEDFFEAYYACRRNKRRTANQLSFEISYEHNLVELWKEVNNKTYEIGKSICFVITRPKLREIFAANFRDRIVHHVIMQRLEPLFEKEFIDNNFNCRVGKGVLYGVNTLKEDIEKAVEDYDGKVYICKYDIKGFFMSIDKELLCEELIYFINHNYKGNDKEILIWLVKKVVMNKPHKNCIKKGNKDLFGLLPQNKSLFTCGDDFGLPIGNLTSQCFANFFLCVFDKRMKNDYKYYGRYVDDFYVLVNDINVAKHVTKFVRRYLMLLYKIKLNDNKIYIQPYYHGVKFIGSVIKNNRVYTANTTISNIYNKIHNINLLLNTNGIDYTHLNQMLNSYNGFLLKTKSYHLRRKMYSLLKPPLQSKISVVNDYMKFKIVK